MQELPVPGSNWRALRLCELLHLSGSLSPATSPREELGAQVPQLVRPLWVTTALSWHSTHNVLIHGLKERTESSYWP